MTVLRMEAVTDKVTDVAILRRMLFATAYLPAEIPHYWATVASFGCLHSSSCISPQVAQITMENIQFLNADAFCEDSELTKELVTMEIGPTKQPCGVPLVSKQKMCPLCGGKLLLRSDRPSRLTLYTESLGTLPGTHYHKYCHNYRKGCKLVHFYGYFKSGDGVMHYSDDCLDLPYFLSTQETGFELAMLKHFDVELLVGQISYMQKADIYNISKGYDTTKKECSTIEKEKEARKQPAHGALKERQQMDRRRFEAAHLKYAALKMAAKYSEAIPNASVTVETDIKDTLHKITPALFLAFEARYAAHTCTYPGCGSVLVFDGNMKNRRDVCYAKEAGFIQFDGLTGSIKTGCPATPEFKSRFCNDHKSNACDQLMCGDVDPDEELDVPTGPALRSHQRKVNPGSPVAEMIVAKKATRKQTYYQVLWLGHPECRATWEPAPSLPQNVIADFEAGIMAESTVDTVSLYGHVSSTLSLSQRSLGESPPKKKRDERPCPDDLEGVFKEVSAEKLTCNTEKDRAVRLNHRTAGILAGMWPCGIITLLRELFLAESKAQVYGHLHQFLKSVPSATALSLKYICYDDGCHLAKYAANPCRRDLTQTTKILSNISIVVDKMHMAGHVDPWCLKNCDPHLFKDLEKVDTEVCEQTFSWLSRYAKMTRRMNRHTYIFFLLYLCELHNSRELEKLKRAKFM